MELITLKTVYVSLTWFGPILARPHCAWHAHRRHLFPPRPGYESSPRQIECRVLIVRTANHDASSLCGGARGIAGQQRRVTARRRRRYRISPVRPTSDTCRASTHLATVRGASPGRRPDRSSPSTAVRSAAAARTACSATAAAAAAGPYCNGAAGHAALR